MHFGDGGSQTESAQSTIFFGGPILTIEDRMPEVEAIAVTQGRIVALGDRKKVFQFHSASTLMVDLQGRTLMPGFIESYVRLAWSAFVRNRCVTISPSQLSNKLQLIDVLRSIANKKKRGEWVIGLVRNPSGEAFATPALTAQDLDKASTEQQVLVIGESGDIAYVNHRALKTGSVTDHSLHRRRVPAPGAQSDGEVHGAEAIASVLSEIGFNETLEGCNALLRDWTREGCTTVYDGAAGALWGLEEVRMLLDLASDPATPVRLRAALVPTRDLPHIAGIRPGQSNDRLSFVGVSFAVDGPDPDLGSGPPCVQSGCRDPIVLNRDDDELKVQMQCWHDSKWQLLLRANTSEGVDQALRVLGAILSESPNPRHRHRIDGCAEITHSQLTKAVRLGVTISHAISRCLRQPVSNRGSEPSSGPIPRPFEFEHDLKVSLHSDWPRAAVAPLRSIEAAVARMMTKSGPQPVPAAQAIIDQALKAITLYPAYQCFLDHKVGSLAVGKLADFVVLDRNPREVDPASIASIEVLQTYVQGALQSSE